MVASGLRIGTPALTTRGMDTDAMVQVGEFIARGLAARDNDTELAAIRSQVAVFAADFPLYPSRQPAQA